MWLNEIINKSLNINTATTNVCAVIIRLEQYFLHFNGVSNVWKITSFNYLAKKLFFSKRPYFSK